ncbi:uncharacterized protein LOC117474901 [Trematomus bernacchii]|uniref:uncharacterized protein LOC117474901 n=1 Tax=Trematomus bernacchii TaxID=40690 RepID=UPI00146F8480|nr:uncharacterized protein LOC117474901 [Trematomus bernacchii]
MPGALGLSAGSQTSCSVRPTTQRHGNSLSHLILAVSTSLQQAPAEPSLLGLSDASLQAFALPSPPRFWPRMPGALGLSAGSQTSCSVRPTTQRHGNSLSHLILAVSTSLQQAPAEPSLLGLSDASLQAFALMLGNWDESCPYGADSSPGLACLVTTVGDMSSGVCQSSQGSCLGQLPCRHWSVLPKLGRPGSSYRVFYRPVPTPSRPRGPSSSRTQPSAYSGGLRRSQRPTHPLCPRLPAF